jgi:hypothetical protein
MIDLGGSGAKLDRGSKRMNLIVKTALTGFVAVIGFGSGSAFAEDASCSCATAYQGSANPIGSVRSVKGNVMVSQATGYETAKAGSGLDFGSRVVVGAKSSASVQVGDCKLSVPTNSSLNISRVGNKICLRLEGSEQSAAGVSSEQTGAIDGPRKFGMPEALFAGMGVTAGVLAATQDDDNGVSR